MSFPKPTFSAPRFVFSLEKMRYNPHDDLIFPSIIRTEGKIEKPLGKFYLYYAPHDAPGGICLAYADLVEGPWTEYGENPIFTRVWKPHYEVSHISGPHVLWLEDVKKFYLYFHGENDTTRIASTTDGIHFEYEGVAFDTTMYEGISEASYARILPCTAREGARFVALFMGNNDGTRRIYAAWSKDGLKWEAQKKPLLNPPPGTEVTQVGAPWYFPWQGKNYVVFHGDKTPPNLSNVSSNLYLAEVGADFTEENHLGIFYSRDVFPEEKKRVSDASFFEDNGRLWLFMSVGPRLKQNIAFVEVTRL
jgi:beta-xylosidase